MGNNNWVFGTLVLMLSVAALGVSAHDDADEILEGQTIVEAGTSCGQLTDGQLEAVGEYLMEQMHPGETHDVMHQMMGIEENTEAHETFHFNLARAMYCGESTTSMMPMMRAANTMMQGPVGQRYGGMMGGIAQTGQRTGYGMMGGYRAVPGYIALNTLLLGILCIVAIIAIVWLIIRLVTSDGKRRKN
jgi:hypothetical protein